MKEEAASIQQKELLCLQQNCDYVSSVAVRQSPTWAILCLQYLEQFFCKIAEYQFVHQLHDFFKRLLYTSLNPERKMNLVFL
jgi:hypothetical protein